MQGHPVIGNHVVNIQAGTTSESEIQIWVEGNDRQWVDTKENGWREGYHLKPAYLSHKKLPAHGLPNLQRAGNVFPHASDMETQIFLSKNLNSASQDQQKTHKHVQMATSIKTIMSLKT